MTSVDIVSLTPDGDRLAKRLHSIIAMKRHKIEHLHCPKPFKQVIQQRFKQKHTIIFICAAGIAVRTLAEVLESKHEDPPILVMDDKGQFVIPLLSGHEGGANMWAQEVAEEIGAQVVITTTKNYTHFIRVVGMGCEKDCSLQSLRSLFESTLKAYDILPKDISALSSIDIKQHEPALVKLANELGIPFVCYSSADLRKMDSQLSERSEIVYNTVGCYSVAEAAALFHSHQITQGPSELVVKKQKNAHATIAVAQSI